MPASTYVSGIEPAAESEEANWAFHVKRSTGRTAGDGHMWCWKGERPRPVVFHVKHVKIRGFPNAGKGLGRPRVYRADRPSPTVTRSLRTSSMRFCRSAGDTPGILAA